MTKILSSKYWWILLLAGLVLLNFLAAQFHYRIDLTSEKRYTLSEPTKALLENLNEPVTITVFLDGDMPAGFRQLSNASRELLEEFKELAGSKLFIRFQRPGEGMEAEAKTAFVHYLEDSLGLKPTNVKVTAAAGEAQEERLLYAGALVTAENGELAVDLLEGQNFAAGYEALNNAEALLEYKFAHAIQKLTRDNIPVIGYLTGNGQPLTFNVYDLIERTLRPNYAFGFVPIDSFPLLPSEFDALLMVKPTQPFTDRQKLKLDQYIMNGGKLIWLIDNLYAEMDSLMRTKSDFVAFDRGLNLEDLLFRYGARINRDLVQDLRSDKIPLVVGNFGNEPQMELVPWPYFPLLSPGPAHPISNNLDHILSVFPNSVDTIEVAGIRKTILLTSSANARSLSTPAIVSLNSVQTEEDLNSFNQPAIPVAVLLEGAFTSLYSNRISRDYADSLANLYRQPFKAVSPENKMIIIADADIVSNVFTQQEGPLTMGYNQFTGVQYANKEFLLNSIEYLVNPSGILQARSKELTLRLLDQKKLETEKLQWQLVNIGIPVLLVIIFGSVFQFLRKRRYGS